MGAAYSSGRKNRLIDGAPGRAEPPKFSTFDLA
jgi:hypothetical protein